jgi:O-antigen biosynthesis protein
MMQRYRQCFRLLSSVVRVAVDEGLGEVLRRAKVVLARISQRRTYTRWAMTYDSSSESRRQSIRVRQETLAWRPRISILMPVYNTHEKWLREALNSVLVQLYPNWELCIADDASTLRHVRATLEEYRARESRIKIVYRSSNGNIAEATNSALALASGEYISLMDHDDAISDDALYELVNKLNEDSSLDMIYSDEDKIDHRSRRFDPAFKPGWSPDYLESCMYTAHLAIYRKSLAERIGGFKAGYDGAQDYDFVLRFTEQASRIAHVPLVLYHWRAIPGSTANSMQDKSYVVPAGVRALRDRLERTGRRGSVGQSRYPGCFDVRVELAERPLVSIVIPTEGRDGRVRRKTTNLISHCVERIRTLSSYPNYEIVIADNGELRSTVEEFLSVNDCRFIARREAGSSLSRRLNLGASIARGRYLLFLHDDVEVISPDWIEALLEQGIKPGVGAVGAKLLYQNGTLQHVGVVHHQGLPGHVRKHFPRSDPGYMFSTISVRNYLAVSGACMLTPADLFEKSRGFHDAYKEKYGDSDYCLKLHALGLRVVYTPHAELYHFESDPEATEVAKEDGELYLERWRAVTARDRYYNADRLETFPPDFSARLRNQSQRP